MPQFILMFSYHVFRLMTFKDMVVPIYQTTLIRPQQYHSITSGYSSPRPCCPRLLVTLTAMPAGRSDALEGLIHTGLRQPTARSVPTSA